MISKNRTTVRVASVAAVLILSGFTGNVQAQSYYIPPPANYTTSGPHRDTATPWSGPTNAVRGGTGATILSGPTNPADASTFLSATNAVGQEYLKAKKNQDYKYLLDFHTTRCNPKDVKTNNSNLEFSTNLKGVGNCFELGELYRLGQGVAPDINKAIGYYQIAADGNFIKAPLLLSQLYLEGKDVPRDVNKGVDYLVKHATDVRSYRDPNIIMACNSANQLGDIYNDGKYVAKNGPESVKWYQYCIDKSNLTTPNPEALPVHALRMIADLQFDGVLIPSDHPQAIKSYNKIIEYGKEGHYKADVMDAQFRLGQLYLSGQGVPQDIANGITLVKAAADCDNGHGYGAPSVALYKLYSAGTVVPSDPVQAAHYLTLAVSSKEPEALVIWARNDFNEKPDEAKSILQGIVVTGYAPAQHALGDYYAKFGAPESGALNGYVWYDFAAQNGDVDAAKARNDLAAKLPAGGLDKAKAAEAQIKAKFPAVAGPA